MSCNIKSALVLTLGIGLGGIIFTSQQANAQVEVAQAEQTYIPIVVGRHTLTRLVDKEFGNVCYVYGNTGAISCVNDLTVNTVAEDSSWETEDSDEIAQHNNPEK